MRPEDFSEDQRQHLRPIGEGVVAYVPPPAPSDIQLSTRLVRKLAAANHALGLLEGTGRQLLNPRLLIGPYLRREAVLSSRIEGTETGLAQLVLVEAGDAVSDNPDVQEVLNYVTALESGIAQLNELPVSLRLVRDLHTKLMQGVRGGDRAPGEFRRLQNFVAPRGTPIERAVFVPPPPGPSLHAALDDWERFIHREDEIPLLVRCAWMHYQFESIHPFIDGNGRTGRLLIPLLLIERGALSQPLLYVSAHLERYRDDYYGALMAGRLRGTLEPWIELFLDAIAAQAREAVATAERLTALRTNYLARFAKSRSATLRSLIDELFARLSVSVPALARSLDVSEPAVQSAVDALVREGILRETTGRKRRRIYLATEIVALIMPEEGEVQAATG
jgi:Fic family protein